MKKYLQILFLSFTLAACAQNTTTMKTPEDAIEKFTAFITKEKFVAQPYPDYHPGLADEKMRPLLTKKIHQIAANFQKLAESENPTEKQYQEIIGNGLASFKDLYLELDTEDRERICNYIEELMDIVELESSNGQLNNFMYGFEPKE